VHGRGRRDGTLTAGRPSLALAGTSIPGSARAGAPAGSTTSATRTTRATWATWGTTCGAGAVTTGSTPTGAVTTGSTATGAITTVTTTTRPALIAVVTVFVTSTGSLA
jgi:hypothetical protein